MCLYPVELIELDEMLECSGQWFSTTLIRQLVRSATWFVLAKEIILRTTVATGLRVEIAPENRVIWSYYSMRHYPIRNISPVIMI